MSLQQVLAGRAVARVPSDDDPALASLDDPALALLDDPALALLDGLAGLERERVLIIGHGAVELMCALIRGGCREVTELRRGDRPEAGTADLVLVPRLVSIEQAAMVVGHARRALLPTGRVVLSAPGHLALPLTRTLRLFGFSALRRRDAAGGSVLSACLPMFALPLRAGAVR